VTAGLFEMTATLSEAAGKLELIMHESPNVSSDAELNTPPDAVPAHPPIATRPQVLPFGELTWENFERLCYRLAGKAQRVVYVARYGRSGQAQQGIDLFARMGNGKYEVWQAKRYASIAAGDVKAIVAAFRTGAWKDKSDRLVLAVQASLADTKVQDEIETQAGALKTEGITFVPHGGEELSEAVRGHPELVDDFFGRGWVKAFLGSEAAKALSARLDGAEFARVRAQLRRFYDAHFHLLDVGVVLPLATDEATQNAPPSLLRRYTVPDVLVHDIVADEERAPQPDKSQEGSDADASAGSPGASGKTRFARTRRRDYVRRASLANWLADGLHLTVVGEAGSGKSTLLRCIALDLLSEQGIFPQIARRWGELLPIHISFSRWSRLSATLGRAAGLKEVVAETLQPALTTDLLSLLNRAIDERRVLLLLDGLDEWIDEQAARTTLQHIMAFVATHNLPTIATARPRGLDKIGTIPSGWRIAELAPLSLDQQRKLAEVWFSRGLPQEAGSGQGSEIRGPIEERLNRFFAELARDRRLSSLAGNPLLLVGLIALSIRQIALPRNRVQAIQSLVTIPVETHPEHRATAAGDTKARFVHIPDADDRRAALGRLAFVARSASGGDTYDIKEARRTIRDYFIDPVTFAYSAERAQNAANEMLAVNAETVGVLAERAPGQIGFAHAVFEEYLAAEHVHRWAFPEMIEFVRARSAARFGATSSQTLFRCCHARRKSSPSSPPLRSSLRLRPTARAPSAATSYWPT
jgi:energy-coupling factor transporter ATP-binding protein EcfA2